MQALWVCRCLGWAAGASPVRLVLLGIGVLATLVLVLRLGQIAMKLGLAVRATDDLEFTGERGRAKNLRAH